MVTGTSQILSRIEYLKYLVLLWLQVQTFFFKMFILL